jgi:hypothetical protein
MMKKIFYVVLAVLFVTVLRCNAQVEEKTKDKEPGTKLERFIAQRGILIARDFYELGEMPAKYSVSIKFTALVVYDPAQPIRKDKGIQVEISERQPYTTERHSEIAFLDLEEMESLSKGIAYMVQLAEEWKATGKQYSEVTFSTLGDFQIGFFQEGTIASAYCSVGLIGKINCFFSSMEDLNSVKRIVDKGKELLAQK